MQETLQTTFASILEVILIVVIPTLALYGGKMLREFIQTKAKSVNNEYIRTMFEEIGDTLESTVAATSQTFVDSLKAAGSFDKEAQKEAMKLSVGTAKKLLNKEAQELIVKTHGDLDLWITTQVDKFVREQKLDKTV